MNLVGRVVQSIKGLYNGINPATLTGAIDVVIVRQEDGTYLCSPFHVRFGKLGVLHSREKVVDIEINGEATDLQMKLGDAGEAFFVQDIESEEEDVLSHLATSPLPSSLELMEKGVKELHQQVKKDGENPRCPSQLAKIKDPRSDSSQEEPQNGKPRRKVLKKKKQKAGNKGNSRSVSMPENMVEEAMFDIEVTNSSEDDEVSHLYGMRSSSATEIQGMDMGIQGTTTHRRISSFRSGSFVMPFSEPETSPIGSPIGSRPSTPKSDTEVDKQHTEDNQNSALLEDTSATWHWGEFPQQLENVNTSQTMSPLGNFKDIETNDQTGIVSSIWKNPKTGKIDKDVTGGIYLEDLTNLDDPEMARIYLGRPRESEEDNESGRGPSLPQSPNSVDGAIGGLVSFTPSEVRHLGAVSLSLCGGLSDPKGITLDRFMQKVVTFEDLAEFPNITLNPDLVVKIHDKYYNWSTSGPMVLSQIVFQRQLPEVAVKDLEKEHMPKKERKKKKSSWFSWGRGAETESSALTEEHMSPPLIISGSSPMNEIKGISASSSTSTLTDSNNRTESSEIKQIEGRFISSSTSSPSNSISPEMNREEQMSVRHQEHQEENTSTETDTDASEKEISKSSPINELTINVDEPNDKDLLPDQGSEKKKRCLKSLRLTSDQIKRMKMKDGLNEIVFSVTTQYQGTTKCVAHIYLWNYDDKIVISDIDGTITKSDALGHILPILGRDWSQSGVAQLYTRITENGYKMIYLSARPIGQSRITKDMLKSIKQGDLVLPDGPMFLNPTSLFSAFHRELIVKNPEEFKISCLKDIAELFPSSPFYSGFGNKINDVIAYRALNIPSFRIFTINPQGQLRHDLSLTFLSSYSGMSDVVDHFFPSLDHVDRATNSQFNVVNYWRKPILSLSPSELELVSETGTDDQEKDAK